MTHFVDWSMIHFPFMKYITRPSVFVRSNFLSFISMDIFTCFLVILFFYSFGASFFLFVLYVRLDFCFICVFTFMSYCYFLQQPYSLLFPVDLTFVPISLSIHKFHSFLFLGLLALLFLFILFLSGSSSSLCASVITFSCLLFTLRCCWFSIGFCLHVLPVTCLLGHLLLQCACSSSSCIISVLT